MTKSLNHPYFCLFRFVAEPQHFPNGRMKLTCMAKIDDLWDDKITKTAYGAGDEGQPKHLIISNYAGM